MLAVQPSYNTCKRAAALLRSFWRWDRAAVVRAAFRKPITATYRPDPTSLHARKLNGLSTKHRNLNPGPDVDLW